MTYDISKPIKPFIKRTSPVFRKCENLMETLWTEGYIEQISIEDLRTKIQLTCGGFRTTVTDYLGARGKQGYLEKFGFIERLDSLSRHTCIYKLHHEKVNRPYHTEHEALSFSLSHKEEEEEVEEKLNNLTVNQLTPTPNTSLLVVEREKLSPSDPNLEFLEKLRKAGAVS